MRPARPPPNASCLMPMGSPAERDAQAGACTRLGPRCLPRPFQGAPKPLISLTDCLPFMLLLLLDFPGLGCTVHAPKQQLVLLLSSIFYVQISILLMGSTLPHRAYGCRGPGLHLESKLQLLKLNEKFHEKQGVLLLWVVLSHPHFTGQVGCEQLHGRTCHHMLAPVLSLALLFLLDLKLLPAPSSQCKAGYHPQHLCSGHGQARQ